MEIVIKAVSSNRTRWDATHSILMIKNTTVSTGTEDWGDGSPILALVLFSFCLATVLGNALVIAAVTRERYLHTVTNYFIMSLAVADCLVGSIVMPFSAAVEMQSDRRWLFGRDLWYLTKDSIPTHSNIFTFQFSIDSDVWHSFDVLVSTASILNLCVISVDRYWVTIVDIS